MSTSEIKNTLHKIIANTDDATLLQKFLELLNEYSKNQDWWDLISDEEKAGIREGLSELETGNGITHKDMIEKHKQWL